jgi:hypothetical protein
MADTKEHVQYVDHVENSGSQDTSSPVDAKSTTMNDAEAIETAYWKSPKFIGSCIAIILLANNLFLGYAIPVSYRQNLVMTHWMLRAWAGEYFERDQRRSR